MNSWIDPVKVGGLVLSTLLCLPLFPTLAEAQWGFSSTKEKAADKKKQTNKKAPGGKKTAKKKVPAQTKAKAAAPVGPAIPWEVNCQSLTGKPVCKAEQRLVIQKTGQLLLGVVVRVPPKSKNGSLLAQLPHGMFFPDGVVISIDGKSAKTHPVQTCDQAGCYVGLSIDNQLLKALKSGKTLLVSFKNLQKKNIQIPVSLRGFAEAYKKLL